MSKKSARIAALIERCHGQDLDAHYLGYFDCFNRGLFYEAHDVLEELWLSSRGGPDDAFYKGLIQLAGAFVHLQKDRLSPAAALLRLASANLLRYDGHRQRLDVGKAVELAKGWLEAIEVKEFKVNPLGDGGAPRLELVEA